MDFIALVQATPKDPEVAILRLDEEERENLHKNALAFVNDNHVFRKSVRTVEIAPSAKTEYALVIIVHLPGCACKVYGAGG